MINGVGNVRQIIGCQRDVWAIARKPVLLVCHAIPTSFIDIEIFKVFSMPSVKDVERRSIFFKEYRLFLYTRPSCKCVSTSFPVWAEKRNLVLLVGYLAPAVKLVIVQPVWNIFLICSLIFLPEAFVALTADVLVFSAYWFLFIRIDFGC